jgi:pyruvate formate-lyase activating enzyme-like uncharacterized protein
MPRRACHSDSGPTSQATRPRDIAEQNVTLTVHRATISLHDAIQHTRPLKRTLTQAATRTANLTHRTSGGDQGPTLATPGCP